MVCLRPATAAQVLAVPDAVGSSLAAVATWENGARLRWLDMDGRGGELAVPAPARAEAMAWVEPCGVVLLGGGKTVHLARGEGAPDCALLGAGPHNVRSAAGLGPNRLVAISGGQYLDGVLKRAQVSLWELAPYPRRLGEGIGPAMNPQALAVGNLEGRACVLISVYKSAILEPVVRLRPWIYRLADRRLVAVWQGSSFSQPYVAAGFADIYPQKACDEVCVLEVTRDGRRQITIYQWRGFVMEGIAQSSPARFGDTIRQAQGTGGDATPYVWVGGRRGRLVGLGVAQWPQNSLARLEPRYQTRQMPRPIAWDIGRSAGKPAAYVLSERGELLRMPLVTCGEGAL